MWTSARRPSTQTNQRFFGHGIVLPVDVVEGGVCLWSRRESEGRECEGKCETWWMGMKSVGHCCGLSLSGNYTITHSPQVGWGIESER